MSIVEVEDEIKQEIKNCANEFIEKEIKNIEKERKKCNNISVAFKSIGEFGEELTTTIYPNSLGSASKGGCSFDNFEINAEMEIIKAREVKTCCHIQSKTCNSCKKKTPYYQEKCSFCKNDTFTKTFDSRFSINAKSHFKYKSLLSEYMLFYVKEVDYTIIILGFIIKSDNVYFNNYLKNQLDNSESNSCNLIPFSYDFYSCGPIKILELVYDLSGNLLSEYIDIFNNNNLDFNTECLTFDEKKKYDIPDERKTIPYKEIEEKLKLRPKNFNKIRGNTTRL